MIDRPRADQLSSLAGEDMIPEITLVRKCGADPLMSKRIFLNAHGELQSDGSQCLMIQGEAERVVAASSIETFPVLSGIEALTILVDNERNNSGQRAEQQCSKRWTAAGREVFRALPNRTGDDFNDVLRWIARQIAENVTGFFKLLAEREEMPASANDNNAQVRVLGGETERDPEAMVEQGEHGRSRS